MIDVIGLGGVGTVQKPSNLVGYYTLGVSCSDYFIFLGRDFVLSTIGCGNV